MQGKIADLYKDCTNLNRRYKLSISYFYITISNSIKRNNHHRNGIGVGSFRRSAKLGAFFTATVIGAQRYGASTENIDAIHSVNTFFGIYSPSR